MTDWIRIGMSVQGLGYGQKRKQQRKAGIIREMAFDHREAEDG
ncbi:hypothetical protein [Paenibacillus sp. H1-7]|nr:hypothetical protein [Paenibacillus sp. H1-7]